MPSPIALFVYNRPEHTQSTLAALASNCLAPSSDLHIFCDGYRKESDIPKIKKVQEICRKVTGFHSINIVEREQNIGLANSVITGVTELLKIYTSLIVLEDDLVTSSAFLDYMNAALLHYEHDSDVFSVGGYTFPPQIMPLPPDYGFDSYSAYRCCSWGWGTWRDRWNRVDWDMRYYEEFSRCPERQQAFDRGGPDMSAMLAAQWEGKIDSWAIRFCYAHFMHDMRCIYPARSFVKNIGLDNSGVHCGVDPRREHLALEEQHPPFHFCRSNPVDPAIANAFRRAFYPPSRTKLSLQRRACRKLSSLAKQGRKSVYRAISSAKQFFIPSTRDADILFVNTLQKTGGAARACWRIFQGVHTLHPTARLLTLLKEDKDTAVDGLTSRKANLARRFMAVDEFALRSWPNRDKSLFSPNFLANPFRISLKQYNPQLVHLHWICYGMLRIEELATLRCPIVWTLHDAWAFTGGCHYTQNCQGFLADCGHCPHLKSDRDNDPSRRLMLRKARAYADLDLTIVTPSYWLADMARHSSLFKDRRIEVIPNGLDVGAFRPMDHDAAKKCLNLPLDKPVLLCGAQSLTDPRKGSDLFIQALKKLKRPCSLVSFGNGHLELQDSPHIHYIPLGTLKDALSLLLAYSAADVFVCPSREDNLPNTVAEALACGTPCVSFDCCGLPNMIQEGINGALAVPFDTESLAIAIIRVLDHQDPAHIRNAARNKVLKEYNIKYTIQKYESLYRDILHLNS